MSRKYQYFAKKRKSYLYEKAYDIRCCKFKQSHFYTTNCYCCIKQNCGRTRNSQQVYDYAKI